MESSIEDHNVSPSDEKLRMIYRLMLRSRLFENKLASLYRAGKIVGGVYLGLGQEAVSVSLAASLDPNKDLYSPLIRDQGGRLCFGETIEEAVRTWLGSSLGLARGRDGNVHRGKPEKGYYAMISHLGAMISVVAGGLLAKRLDKKLDGCVGATCIGDGGTSTGAFHEAMNLIAVEKLPVVVVVVNNQYAYSTPTERQFACKNLVDKAIGYGITGHEVDGTDFIACVDTVGKAVEQARSTGSPQMVVANLLRLSGHGEHDSASYVSDELKKSGLGRDCLEVAKAQLLESNLLSEEEFTEWSQEAVEEIQAAITLAQKDPSVDPYKESWVATSNKDVSKSYS